MFFVWFIKVLDYICDVNMSFTFISLILLINNHYEQNRTH